MSGSDRYEPGVFDLGFTIEAVAHEGTAAGHRPVETSHIRSQTRGRRPLHPVVPDEYGGFVGAIVLRIGCDRIRRNGDVRKRLVASERMFAIGSAMWRFEPTGADMSTR